MKNALLKFSMFLYGVLYSLSVLQTGLLSRAWESKQGGTYYVGSINAWWMFITLLYLALRFFGKLLQDEWSKPKAYFIQSAMTTLISAYVVRVLFEEYYTYRYPIEYPILTIICTALIVISYIICAVITIKEDKEKYKV